MSLLLAQAAIEPLAGGSGWVGAGLLGLVLSWLLMVHLPAKDKQIRDLMEANDTKHREARAEYRDTLAQILAYGERHITTVATQLANELERLREAIEAIAKGDR